MVCFVCGQQLYLHQKEHPIECFLQYYKKITPPEDWDKLERIVKERIQYERDQVVLAFARMIDVNNKNRQEDIYINRTDFVKFLHQIRSDAFNRDADKIDMRDVRATGTKLSTKSKKPKNPPDWFEHEWQKRAWQYFVERMSTDDAWHKLYIEDKFRFLAFKEVKNIYARFKMESLDHTMEVINRVARTVVAGKRKA